MTAHGRSAASGDTPPTRIDIERAITAMLHEYRDNSWMLAEHWPLNEPHVRLMVADIVSRHPPGPDVHVLDVGCFNGYISVLFRRLGYRVTGTDACDLADRRTIFDKADIEFVYSNMNDVNPCAGFAAESFDVVIIAQVIEHILNHPLGLMRSLAGVMRPGGVLILTTPNPATIMGAVRMLRGHSLLWGTKEFIDEPKIGATGIITKGEIHYREYTDAELRHLLTGAGFHIERSRYIGLGIPKTQSRLKRIAKKTPLGRRFMSTRLLASNHYVVARKPAPGRISLEE